MQWVRQLLRSTRARYSSVASSACRRSTSALQRDLEEFGRWKVAAFELVVEIVREVHLKARHTPNYTPIHTKLTMAPVRMTIDRPRLRDCDRFVSLTERAQSSPPDAAVALLDEALQLVDGPPFRAASGYSWAYSDGTETLIAETIKAVGRRCVELHLERNQALAAGSALAALLRRPTAGTWTTRSSVGLWRLRHPLHCNRPGATPPTTCRHAPRVRRHGLDRVHPSLRDDSAMAARPRMPRGRRSPSGVTFSGGRAGRWKSDHRSRSSRLA